MKRTVGFFIGSGCSFPSNQPSVKYISECLLSGDSYLIEALDDQSIFTGGLEDSYPRWGPRSDLGPRAASMSEDELLPWREPARSVQELLAYIVAIPEWQRPPTYEDVSGLLRVISGSLQAGTNDPLTHAFIKQHGLHERLHALEFPAGHRYFGKSLGQQVAYVEDFIGWVVARHILVQPELVGYDAFAGTVRTLRSRQWPFHIVTTNYDCNLERLLAREGIPFHDGLVSEWVEDDAGRAWRHGRCFRFFDRRTPALIKLHGSINWYACHDTYGSGAGTFAIADMDLEPADAFCSYIRLPTGHMMTPKYAPEMLRGALSKAGEYSYDGYSHLLVAFESVLERADVLVVAGFGWADEAIAVRLLRFARTEGKSLLLLDGSEPEPAVFNEPSVTQRMVGKPGEGRSLSVHRQHMSAMDAQRVLELIDTCAHALG